MRTILCLVISNCFMTYTWMVTLTGIICIWRALGYPGNSRSGFLLAGGLLQGWAVFNLIEGILNHHLLRLHHVREITGSTDLWNFGFLILSVLLLFIGIFISRRARRASFVP